MSTQPRNNGKFQQKSDHPRKVRSIRVTDPVWDELARQAYIRYYTPADFLEELIISLTKKDDQECKKITPIELELIITTLRESLNLKGNATSKIKTEVIKVLEILENLQ